MKKWLKKHSKCLVIGFAILFIASTSYGIIIATEEWQIALNGVALAIWAVILFFSLGVMERIYDWWYKNRGKVNE